MLTMRDHGVDDYSALRHMDGTDVGVLGEDDQHCLDELGEYLVGADARARFGVWLLHKHFEPRVGEVFVERSIPWPPQTHTTPIARAAFSPMGLHATAVRFDPDAGSALVLVGMEFAGPADFGAVAPLSAADEAVLAGLAARLRAHAKTDRFGVRLIRNQLGLSEDQVLLETCDSVQRALHCDVVERPNMPANTIDTAWEWEPAPTPTMGCLTTLTCVTRSCKTCMLHMSHDQFHGTDTTHIES
jgi:hypothetical protein